MFLNESDFLCPVCRTKLFALPSQLKCLKGHSFDVAKQGYVNLLLDNAHNKRHGDDKLMVKSRTDFLEKGYYEPLRKAVCDVVGIGHNVLDSGCGEGYYTEAIARCNSVCGIDISKDALKVAAKRCETVSFAVASIGDIPLKNGSRDVIVNIFAPDNPDEFSRVLCDGGRLINVQPMERHLFGLKSAIYDEPYLNPAVEYERDGFELLSKEELKYSITLDCNEDIISLFKMTPYYYKTGKTDQEKLTKLDTLTTEVEFCILEYQKL